MKNQKMYEAGDKMISLIADNYSILQSLGRFGINLGFGDKTVKEVCEEQDVDTYTFLAIVNFCINGHKDLDESDRWACVDVSETEFTASGIPFHFALYRHL